MRPRQIASEYRLEGKGAEWDYGASMRPRQIASEYTKAQALNTCGRLSFNEAEANSLGILQSIISRWAPAHELQ